MKYELILVKLRVQSTVHSLDYVERIFKNMYEWFKVMIVQCHSSIDVYFVTYSSLNVLFESILEITRWVFGIG